MPGDEYASAGGGSLKLKGVSGSSKISKKKKRPKAPEQSTSSTPDTAARGSKRDDEQPTEENLKAGQDVIALREEREDAYEGEEIGSISRGKTEAELRHEERRRKRVCSLT